MRQQFFIGWGVLLLIVVGCGETINYDLREEIQDPSTLSGSEQAESLPNSTQKSGDARAPSAEAGSEAWKLACASSEVTQLNTTLRFPELPLGQSCAFASDDKLSRKDGYIRAYDRQFQDIELPEGAQLCSFQLQPTPGTLRYDDEMIFTLADTVLLATKDYTEFFPQQDIFYQFSWEKLRNTVYNQFEDRPLYCLGAELGLSRCELPPTDTTGTMALEFSDEVAKRLAVLLKSEKRLRFSWITIGDNDDSDCRHTPLEIDVTASYLLR